MLLAFFWYLIDAHKWFKGPKVFLANFPTYSRSTSNIVCWAMRVTSSTAKKLKALNVAVSMKRTGI
jgi:hypothetical protein